MMTLNKAIETLQHYNRWRRGEEVPMPNPTKIGEAIDVVLEKLTTKKQPKPAGLRPRN
jgi:hypothetical protein